MWKILISFILDDFREEPTKNMVDHLYLFYQHPIQYKLFFVSTNFYVQ